jgi:hypothetical protein
MHSVMRQALPIFAVVSLLSACKTEDPLYCDETKQCADPQRPYCDLEGEYAASDGVARTCIPPPFDAGVACSPNDFLGCDGTAKAVYCPEAGVGEETKDCNAVCSEGAGGCACECPAGPEGPAGPAGPGFEQCEWQAITCSTPGPGVECQAICPTGTLVFAGGCDLSAGGTVVENRPGAAGPLPPPPKFDRWICESSSGNVQGAYALCCPE